MRTTAIRHLAAPLVVVVALLTVGTLGYRVLGGWAWLDALYMTVITITTVGFHEVQPLGPAGRLFTMGLALGGVFTAFYAAGAFIRAIVTGEIRTVFGRQRMEHQLAKLNNHLVVCGFGRMGQLVCEEFSEARIPFVVIDRDPDRPRGLLDAPRHSPDRATPPRTTCSSRPGSSAPGAWSPPPPPTPTTSTSP